MEEVRRVLEPLRAAASPSTGTRVNTALPPIPSRVEPVQRRDELFPSNLIGPHHPIFRGEKHKPHHSSCRGLFSTRSRQRSRTPHRSYLARRSVRAVFDASYFTTDIDSADVTRLIAILRTPRRETCSATICGADLVSTGKEDDKDAGAPIGFALATNNRDKNT